MEIMEILTFFVQTILPPLGFVVSLAFTIKFLKGCNWVTFNYIGLKEK